MDNEMTVEMRHALDEVVATYGDSSPTSVAERAYWAIRAVDPAFSKVLDALPVSMDDTMEVHMEAFLKRLQMLTLAFEMETRRSDKIEEDAATLAGHIAGIKATLAEIAAAQQTQLQQAALLAGRVDATEQATTAIKEVMSAYDERVRQVSASMGELRRAARDKAAEIIMRPKDL